MNRSNFGDIRVFVEVARRNGFRVAADHLKQAPASISEAVQRLEDRLGVRLFERSTRSVVLTPIGEQLYQKALPAIAEIEGALVDLNEQKDEVAGTLRLSAPYSAGPFFLDDLVARFAAAYPSVTVEVIYDDKKVDLLTSSLDAAIRSNTLLALDTHAVSVGPELKMSIVGSRDYFKERGKPKEPRDILDHDAICFAFGAGGKLAPWSFLGPEGNFTIQPEPRMIANDMRSLLYYTQQGLGLTYIYSEIAAPFLKKGDMVEVLSDHLGQMSRYSLNYLSKKNMTRRLRAFIDMAKQ